MGQQQLIIIVVGVIIVCVAIMIGIELFTGTSVSSNKDAIINDLLNLGQHAYRYKLRPEPLGGGARYYTGFTIPTDIASNKNAAYQAAIAPLSVTFIATSGFGYGTISAVLDSNGTIGAY